MTARPERTFWEKVLILHAMLSPKPMRTAMAGKPVRFQGTMKLGFSRPSQSDTSSMSGASPAAVA
jgi:hypothetical protein